jgi:hypothetical protein
MDHRDSQQINYSSGDGDGESDGPPWKPTRAGRGTIVVLLAVCGVFGLIFLMFILRVF